MQVRALHLSAMHSVGKPGKHLSLCGSLNGASANLDIFWHVAPSPHSTPCPAMHHSVTAELN